MDEEVELLIVPTRDALGIRTPIAGILTTIGSDRAADVRLPDLPLQWAVLQRDGFGFVLRVLGTGASHRLSEGAAVTVDGVGLTITRPQRKERGLPVARLAEVLTEAQGPEETLGALLRDIIVAAQADGGALILHEDGSYAIAVAQDGEGAPLADAAQLLSDTIVREVLARAGAVHVADAAKDHRYASVPSVVALRLRSVLCVPMTVYGGVVGAIFLGKRELRDPFPPRVADDLAVIAAMAVPLLTQLRRASSSARKGSAEESIVGECPAIEEVRRLAQRVGASDLSVLLLGQTGTGKEVVAHALHAASSRRDHPLVAINCSALPEGLLAAELFGCRKGAFTGAVADRRGRIEQAHKSTLFLDEVGDMPLAMQAALLRVLEQREVVRLGENTPRAVDFRLVAATHKDLDAEVRAGRFREDLLYRLREFTLVLPPLAERGDDVVLLARLFLRQTEQQLGLPIHRIGPVAIEALRRHRWPGNVRELRSAMRRAAVLADGKEIAGGDLQLLLAPRPVVAQGTTLATSLLEPLDRPLADAKEAFVGQYVAAVIARHGGDRQAAAAALGVSLRSLYRYLPTGD